MPDTPDEAPQDLATPAKPPAATHAEHAAKKRPDLSDGERRHMAEAASREEDP